MKPALVAIAATLLACSGRSSTPAPSSATDAGARPASAATDSPPAAATPAPDGGPPSAYDIAIRLATAKGWTLVNRSDQQLVLAADRDGTKFRGSLVVQDLSGQEMPEMTTSLCAELASALAASKGATVEVSEVITVGTGRGCHSRIASNATAQATIQYGLAGGGRLISILCNRDKAGDDATDALCMQIAREVWSAPAADAAAGKP